MPPRRKFLMLDTSALEVGVPELHDVTPVVTPGVLRELERRGRSEPLRTLVEEGMVEVLEPGEEALKEVLAAASSTGDGRRLSPVDVEVLAAALVLSSRGEVHLLTDDVSMQNVAMRLGISAAGAIVGRRRKISWIYYCPGCGASFSVPPADLVCPICGTALRRKARGRKRFEVDRSGGPASSNSSGAGR